MTKRLACSAAVSALVYIEVSPCAESLCSAAELTFIMRPQQFELSATTPTSPPTHRAYSAQFYHHCHAQGVQYDLAYERVDGQDESLMKCTIRVDGKEAVGTGGRKGEAKEE